MPDNDLMGGSFMGQPGAESDQADIDYYMTELSNDEKMAEAKPRETNVVPLHGGEFEPHMLQPEEELSLPDWYFSKMISDSEQYLDESMLQQWLIDQVLPRDCFGILFGPSGSYKSFMALDMAASIANAKDWHGYDIDTPGLVIYIAGEGARGLNVRHVAWMRKYKVKTSRLFILPIAVPADHLMSSEALIQAVRQVEEQVGEAARLIIVDTLARSIQGDENKAQDMGAFVRGCDKWRMKLDGCSVIVVAHTGYDTTHARGSTALFGACDVVYKVISKQKSYATLSFEKVKDDDKPLDMIFKMEKVPLGKKDRKEREIISLVPFLEDRGDEPDEADEESPDAMDGGDLKALVGMVRAAQREMRYLTEDQLREEYKAYRLSGGASVGTVRKAWSRHFKMAFEREQIYREGKLLYPVKGTY